MANNGQPTDYLTHFLKRLPADQALTHALSQQVLDRITLSKPLLILDDDTPLTELDNGAVVSVKAHGMPGQSWLNDAGRVLQEGGMLAAVLPAHSDKRWQTTLNNAGFLVEQWQPLLSDGAYKAGIDAAATENNLIFDLTGHTVLPLKSRVTRLANSLREYVDEPVPTEGHYVAVLAKKMGDSAIEQAELPPIMPFQRPEEAPIAVVESTPITRDRDESREIESGRSLPETISLGRWAVPVLAGVALLAGWMVNGALRDTPDAPMGAIGTVVVALTALFGMTQLSERPLTVNTTDLFRPNRLIRAGIILFALLLSRWTWGASGQPFVAIPALLLASIVGGLALYGRIPDSFNINRPSRLTLTSWIAINAVLIGLLFRYWAITAHPYMLNGIEARLGIEAAGLTQVFGTTWLTNPVLPLYLQKGMIGLFGRSTLAVRFLSPLIGTATIALIYLLGKRLWDGKTGALSAILLAGSHTHIHYSRLGMTNVYDPLIALAAMGGIAWAWQSKKRSAWLFAGVAVGLSAYVYTAAHLLPLALVTLAVLMIVFHGRTLLDDGQWKHIAAAILLAFIIAQPQIRAYRANPDNFMDRANALGIQRNGWLAREVENPEKTFRSTLSDQFWQAALGFNATVDKDLVYNPKRPLTNVITGTLFLLGVGIALFNIRKTKYHALLALLGITVIFGGMLLIEPPHSRRLLIALPAVMLLAARAAVLLIDRVVSPLNLGGRADQIALISLLVIGGLSAGLNALFYFGSYAESTLFGDRNTEVAHTVGTQLSDLSGDEWAVYFYAAPIMYANADNIPFLAPQFERGFNIYDMESGQTAAPTSTDAPPNKLFIFLPERDGDLQAIQAEFPGGVVEQINGRTRIPLYTTYAVTP